MGIGSGLYMFDVVVKKFTFTVSCPDEFLCHLVVLTETVVSVIHKILSAVKKGTHAQTFYNHVSRFSCVRQWCANGLKSG